MAFKKYRQKNLAAGELDADLGASGTLVVLKAGQGALFPSTFPFAVKIEEYDTQGRVTKRNMAECTTLTGDALTVVRSSEACPASFDAVTQTTTALAFAAGSSVFQVTSAAQLDDVQDEVSRLETAKLDKVGTLRTGLTAKRVLITDASGNETELSGTSGQMLTFDADGDPVATTPVATLPDFFGDGSDGDLTVSSGTTTLSPTNGQVFKQYGNLTISGGTLECGGEFNHIYVSGTLTVSSGTVHANGKGGAGGAQSVNGTPGRDILLDNKFTLGALASGTTP